MGHTEPVTELDARYGDEGAEATTWIEGRDRAAAAPLWWLTTVRPDGRPHVTPLLAVWLDDTLYFCTGPDERKAKNLANSSHCVVTTGCNAYDVGFDLVFEGDAVREADDATLRRVAAAYEAKYGSDWHFEVRDGAFHHQGGEAWVFGLALSTAFGFGKGPYSQTRWRFASR
jgi:hypothetical protein